MSATELWSESPQDREPLRRYGASLPSYRLIDTQVRSASSLSTRLQNGIDEEVTLPDGRTTPVVDVYDDEFGQEGGVVATPAVDDD
jgi:hypothetical protein